MVLGTVRVLLLTLVFECLAGCQSADKINLRGTASTLQNIALELERYRAVTGTYPETPNLDMALNEMKVSIGNAQGESSVTDSWGNPIRFKGRANTYTLESCGKNGTCGGQVNRDNGDWDDDLVIVAGSWVAIHAVSTCDPSVSAELNSTEDTHLVSMLIEQSQDACSYVVELATTEPTEVFEGDLSWNGTSGDYSIDYSQSQTPLQLAQRFRRSVVSHDLVIQLRTKSHIDLDYSNSTLTLTFPP